VAGRALLAFLARVARKDRAELRRLKRNKRFAVKPGRFSFTLPDLHRFLRRQDGAFAGVDYKQFRRLTLLSPVNRTVKAHGAEVVVADNRGKADRSRYALVWRD
jgi:hypothetical protein